MDTDKVLILGNGISRLQYTKEIADWKGELWGCNHIYAEYGPVLTRVNGHADVVKQAQQWKEIHGFNYWVITAEDYQDIPEKLRGNSGIYLVSQALYEGYKEINLCGYDFGGKDVWTPDMEKRNVTNGLLNKWDVMITWFADLSAIRFWQIRPGYDALSAAYLSVFETDHVQVRALKAAIRKQEGQEIIPVKAKDVSEKTRGNQFYTDRLCMPAIRGKVC